MCPNGGSSPSSAATSPSKSGSYDSEYSEACALSDNDADCINADVDFLREVVQRCKWIGLAHFAMVPLVFALAKSQYTELVFAVVVLQVFSSLTTQVRIWRLLADWVLGRSEKAWQKHVEALSLRTSMLRSFPAHELLVYFGTLSEALDPAMDAWTAANSEHMCTPSVREKFAAAWAPAPLVGRFVGRLGLPAILLSILCLSTVVQLWEFLRQESVMQERLESLRQAFLLEDEQEAALHRWRFWIRSSHMADVGGVMLLHNIFQEPGLFKRLHGMEQPSCTPIQGKGFNICQSYGPIFLP